MARKLKFIHAADLHLGAPFRGLRGLSPSWQARLLRALAESFDRVIEEALEREVDFVIIAGDVFDSSRASYSDYQHFFAGMRRLDAAGIPVYMVTGNHDPYTSWQKDFASLPPNVTMFSAERPSFALFERAGQPLCLLCGRGYYNQTWPIDENIAEGLTREQAKRVLAAENPRAALAPFAVGVLHTGLNLDPIKAPVKPRILYNARMNYWALGHIHARCAFPSEDNPQLVFSGCIQGRDIKETGPRGIYEVTLEEGRPNRISFIPTASVVWQQFDFDVSRATTLNNIVDQLMRELFRLNGKAHCEEMVERITLVGTTALHDKLTRPDILADLRKHINDSYPLFFCDTLIDKTKALRDKKALYDERMLPASLLRISQSQRGNPDEALVFLQDEFIKAQLRAPSFSAKDIEKLSGEAEDLVLDLISQEANQ